MDERYYDYYQAVFTRVGDWPGVLPAAGAPAQFGVACAIHDVIARTTDETQARVGVKVRPDAQFFLFLNLWQMVARPVLSVRNTARSELLDDISEDVHMLLAAAAQEGGEVSGHAVVNALSRNSRA